MKDYAPTDIRNISLIGHGASGKTSLSEALVFAMKGIERKGSVDEGTTLSDYMPDEIERKSSISASVLAGEYKKKKFNILDTPGFSDFLGEVKGALRVSDYAVTVIHGVSGVEVVTEQVWDFAKESETPRGFFVNQLDKENADFEKVIDALTETFESPAVLQYAVNPGPGFNKIIDLLKMKLLTFNGANVEVSEIPGDLQGKADELREQLVERAAEADDDLMEKYFEEGELSKDDMITGLKKGILSGAIFPVLCGAATSDIGVAQLLDFVGEYCPSPLDRLETGRHPESGDKVELTCDPEGKTHLLVFKTTTEAHIGEMSYFRVYSGTLRSGDEVKNLGTNVSEKINQMFISKGKERSASDHISAGDIGCLVKLKSTFTGNTLTDPKELVLIDPPEFPEPSIRGAVISKAGGDEDKIAEGLQILQKADPTFTLTQDTELSQMIISGQGDAQLNVILSRLKERFGVEAELIEPKIPYRETIKGKGEAEGKHKKQSGGRGQFGISWIRVEPRQRGEGYEFVDEIVGGVIPRQFIPAVDKGIQESLSRGVIAGYKVVDVKATVFDGKYHPVDSDEFSFKMAGSIGFREAVKKTKAVILEPIYDVDIKVPQDNMGDVMGDVSSRRGRVSSMDSEGKWQIIKAQIPLAELYKYANTLRSLTSGRGMHRRKFSHYEEVPGDIQQKLIEEYEAKRAEGN